MKINTFGLLLFDGKIFINKIYISPFKDEKYNFIIFFALFHEYTHVLSRLLRGNDIFFSKTEVFANNINKADESGFYFENKFLTDYLEPPTITKIELNTY